MSIKYPSRRVGAIWLLVLLIAVVALSACGAAATSQPEEADTAAVQTEEPVEEPAEKAATSQESEAAPAQETETADNENLLAPEQELASTEAACHAATALNDPIMAALQPNIAITTVTDEDWAKGPADAAITLIEYGDFQ